MIAFRRIDTGATLRIEKRNGQPLDVALLDRCLAAYTLVSFNGNHYDIPMISAARAGMTCAGLKALSDRIILGNLKSWDVARQFEIELLAGLDHIDLIEVAPGMVGLKIYGGRLHSRRMQDLPYEHDTVLTPDQMQVVSDYCVNDLDVTVDLYNDRRPQIALREQMSAQYGIDLRSKSDAQIAEAVITSEVAKILGTRPKRPDPEYGKTFRYRVPSYLRFETQAMRDVLEMVRNAKFVISNKGTVEMPDELHGARIPIGRGVYRMGIGGLHSSEESIAHVAGGGYVLRDRDVTSYYPAIILNQQLFPACMGRAFLAVFKSIVERRIAAKRAGDKVTADALKIVINGTFGKLGSPFSVFYAPEALIQVTISGQLSLLMLIEMLYLAAIEVVSANTDGIVIRAREDQLSTLNYLVKRWEQLTGFETEETEYCAVYSRDVNNYVAIKPDGTTKGKGVFADAGIAKNPQNEICVEAVRRYLSAGVSIRQTIDSCTDVRKFLTVRTVKGGAIWNTRFHEPTADEVAGFVRSYLSTFERKISKKEAAARLRRLLSADFLGKAVRWYHSTLSDEALYYKTANASGTHNRVPNSDGAMPLMQLPSDHAVPIDLDRDFYVRESYSILEDLGAF